MNEYGVRTTIKEKDNFPYDEYPLINCSGTFQVTLKDKMWGNNMNIICAFEADTGYKFRVSIIRRTKDELYAPGNSPVDFSKALIDSHFTCSFVPSKGKFFKMSDAVPLD